MRNIIIGLFFAFTLSAIAQPELSSKIPYPFFTKSLSDKNEMTLIEKGLPALQLRVDMIRRAKKSIEVEYFIFNTDTAGKILVRELIKAATGPNKVKVRILVDKSIAVLQLDEYYAKELARYGISVRYYNNAPLYRVSTIQFRNHRKLMVVDNKEALTGGRNIGDDYFDLSSEFNFNDLDVYVKGPIVKTMKASFDKYFAHEIAERPEFPQKQTFLGQDLTSFEKKTAEAKAFLKETQKERQIRIRMKKSSDAFFQQKKSHSCPVTTYSTDAPGANFNERMKVKFDETHRFLRKTLYDKVVTVDQNITISSPYILNNAESRDLFKKLKMKGVKIDVFTNSLASTDAVYVAANLYLGIKEWMKDGVSIYLHDGKWIGDDLLAPLAVRKAVWGTHSKTMVYESRTYSEIMIGTYNVDNRSNFYNSEMAIFCRDNEDLKTELKDIITHQMEKGMKVNQDGTATNRYGKKVDMYGTTMDKVLIMGAITLPSWLLKFLL